MLLAIDTSTRLVGIALYDGVSVLSEETWHSDNYHTVQLAPAVQYSIKRANGEMSKLQAVAVATGPGSFTGLRIGMALAKGLALAQHIPLIGVRTLDVLVASQPLRGDPLAAVLQAGRGRLAVGWYQAASRSWKAIGEPEILTAEALVEKIESPTYVCGEFSADERRILERKRKLVTLASPAMSLRRPSFLAEIAWRRLQKGNVDDPITLSPEYLHFGEPIT